MNINQLEKEQLRQTQIMTYLSEKRTILSEIRTWVTMVLLPISIITAIIAIIKTGFFDAGNILGYILVFSALFILVIIYFIIKNIKELFELNKRLHKIGLPN
jgi:FtsH-binding integral membrane protein